MTDSDLEVLKAIERNGVGHSVYWCDWSKMSLVEHPNAVVTVSELPCPFFNNIFSADIPDPDAESTVDDLIRRFQSRKVPCFWWSGPVIHDQRIANILEDRGFAEAFQAAAMAIDLSSLDLPISTAVRVDEIVEIAEMADWSRTCSSAFEFDNSLSTWWHELFTNIPFGVSTPLRHFIARLDGEPVGTASAYIKDGVAGLASVGVRGEYRRRGIGSALTLTALARAQTLGCRLGALFASPMATSMYASLGFRRYGTGHCYLWAPSGTAEKTYH